MSTSRQRQEGCPSGSIGGRCRPHGGISRTRGSSESLLGDLSHLDPNERGGLAFFTPSHSAKFDDTSWTFGTCNGTVRPAVPELVRLPEAFEDES